MADDPHNTSDISDTVDVEGAKEDAETTAARRELKQTSISENGARHAAQSSQDDKSGSDDDTPADKGPARTPSPQHGVPKLDHHELREQVSSPKKKRAHDEVDESHEEAKDSPKDEESSDPPSTVAVTKSRSDRSEPEKKRPRDRQADEETRNSQDEDEPRSADSSTRSSLDQPRPDAPASEAPKTSKGAKVEEPKKSTSAFANSAFGKLASSTTSPFGALGSSSGSKPSLFGGAGASSGFGGGSMKFNPAGSKSGFGGGSTAATVTTTGTAAASPFGSMNGSTGKSIFGSNATFGSAFGSSALAAPRLSTFAKPGDALASDKPARPFGAPESDAEDSDEEDKDQESGDEDGEKDENKEEDKDKMDALDEKKIKLRKVEVDNGESNEVTLLVVRAKMFQMEKGEGWKERGAGMLKVNVPKSTVELDDAGNPDATSFDASVLDEDEESNKRQNVRLIMRQDHTLRVILNTPILPAMTFKLDKKLKASFVLFTAFDGNEVKQVQLKLSDANATAFTKLMDLLKRQLSDV